MYTEGRKVRRRQPKASTFAKREQFVLERNSRRSRALEREKLRHQKSSWKTKGIINADGTPFTYSDYTRLFQLQEGRCKLATCNKHQSELGIALAADHDHTTGIIRGLLCDSCNRHKVGCLTLKEALAVVEYLEANTSKPALH